VTDNAVPPLIVRVMGVTVAIEVPDEETRERLARQWSRAVVAPPPGQDGVDQHVQAANGPHERRAAHDYSLTTQVTMAALRATSGRRVNLHAGGLADGRGRVLAVVGPSGTGKTTATLRLATRLGYVSDETVSLDPDGRVHPHAKPLSVVTTPAIPRDKQQFSPDDLGLLPTPEHGELARLLVLRRGVPEPRGLIHLDMAEGVLELVEQSSSLADLPTPLHTLVELIGGVGGVWALEYDEIEDHLDQIVAFLAADLPSAPQRTVIGHLGGGDPLPASPGSIARTAWIDAVELDDSLVVLTAGRAVRLDNLMATIWLTLSGPRTFDELVHIAVGRHGAHPESHDLVRRAVELMGQEGLVIRGALA
jgi:hypothetical protein